MKFQNNRKSKAKQYVIGGTVSVIMLALWISLPLMSGSSLDSSVSAGNPFSSRVADISLLGSDIAPEAGAPGSPLSGEMIYNPATSGEDIASSLFQSGISDGEAAASSASAGVQAPLPGGPGSASAGTPAPSAAGPHGRLHAAASITGGNSNSMTTGSMHGKFFGSGNQKSDFAPVDKADLKKPTVADKRNSLVAMLGNSANKSELAAKTGKMDAARGGASSAFGGAAAAKGMDLNDNLEQAQTEGGLNMGQAASDLKKNDPSLNKTKVTPPAPPKDITDESEETKKQIKMMVIQMVLKVALGIAFQGMIPAGV